MAESKSSITPACDRETPTSELEATSGDRQTATPEPEPQKPALATAIAKFRPQNSNADRTTCELTAKDL